MNNADLANERAFAEVKRLCLMGLDATTLRRRVAERMRSAVPYEAYAAFTMDPSNGLITHALQTIGDQSGLRVYLERVFFEDDALEFDWMARNRLPAGLLSEATGGKLERAPRYRELVGPERSVLARNSGAGWPFGGRRDARTLPQGRSPSCAEPPRT
jgi:hypothetical protein